MTKRNMRLQQGKYKGKTYEYVYMHNTGYCDWICDQPAGKMVRFFKFIKWYLERRKLGMRNDSDSDCS